MAEAAGIDVERAMPPSDRASLADRRRDYPQGASRKAKAADDGKKALRPGLY